MTKKNTKRLAQVSLPAVLCTVLLLPMLSYAGLTQLSEADMASAKGQSGLLVDAQMQINRSQDAGTKAIGEDITCSDAGACEFALSLQGDTANLLESPSLDPALVGNQNWLVLYDLSGGIDLKNLNLAATTVSPASGDRSAIYIGAKDSATPVTAVFDDFGAASWGFATDQVEAGEFKAGYRVSPDTGSYGHALDAGRPEGFWDLRVNGTLTMTGGIKLFSCEGMSVC